MLFPTLTNALPLATINHLSSMLTAVVTSLSIECNGVNYNIINEIGDIGGSGTGHIYRASNSKDSENVVVKRSWPRRVYLSTLRTSASIVSRECQIMQHLEEAHIDNIARCARSCYDPWSDQSTSIMYPLFTSSSSKDTNPDTASFASIQSINNKQMTIDKYLNTIGHILLDGHVVIADIQVLVNSETGDFLLIDFTEARIIHPNSDTNRYTSQDVVDAKQFLRRAIELVPAEYRGSPSKLWRTVMDQRGGESGSSQLEAILVDTADEYR
jgi:hypothetical protein